MATWVSSARKEKQSAGRHGDKFWEEEKNSFGARLMARMGWKQGEGLGQQGEGISSYLQSSMKNNTMGLGATITQSDETYTAAQSLYNDLLSKLNSSNVVGDGQVKAEVDHSTASNTDDMIRQRMNSRRLYSRFTRGKSLSNCSQQTMDEIMGRKSSSTAASTALVPAEGVKPSQNAVVEATEPRDPTLEDTSVITIKSTVSSTDYFASKLSSLASVFESVKSEPASSSSSEAGTSQYMDQSQYYNMMMGVSQTGRGGLGSGMGTKRDRDDEYYYSTREKERESRATSSYRDADDEIDEETRQQQADSLFRKLAHGGPRKLTAAEKAKNWSLDNDVNIAGPSYVDEPAPVRAKISMFVGGESKTTATSSTDRKKEKKDKKDKKEKKDKKDKKEKKEKKRKREESLAPLQPTIGLPPPQPPVPEPMDDESSSAIKPVKEKKQKKEKKEKKSKKDKSKHDVVDKPEAEEPVVLPVPKKKRSSKKHDAADEVVQLVPDLATYPVEKPIKAKKEKKSK